MMNKNIDIMNVEEFPNYDIIYTDPPWENNMVKFFDTQRKKLTGVETNNNIQDILEKLATLSNKNKPIFVEYSIKGSEALIDIFVKKGHTFSNKVIGLQSNKKPYIIICFNTDFILKENLIGGKIVEYVINGMKPNTVFDPFAGIGFTAKLVLRCGSKYIGYEYSKARFDRLNLICEKYESL